MHMDKIINRVSRDLKDNGVSRRDRVSFIGGNRYFTPLLLTDQMKQQM